MGTVANLRFYHEPEQDFELSNWVKLISIIQFITEFITIFHVSYILLIFIQIKVCHINLRGICYLFLCDLIIKAIFNMIILFKFITGKTFVSEPVGYLIINFLQWTSQTSCYFYLMSFALERSVSLIWAKNYEKFVSSILLIGLCAFPLLLATPHWNDVNADGFFRLILDAAEAFLFLVLSISFTFTHSKLKEKYLSIFKCFKKQIHVSDSSIIQVPNVVHSVMGKDLAYKNEKELYFIMLTSEWDEKLKAVVKQ